MKQRKPVSLLRCMFATTAVLMVAGPGMVLAGGPTSLYAVSGSLNFPAGFQIKKGNQFQFVLTVTNSDGTTRQLTSDPNLTWSATFGQISSSGLYTATTTGRDRVVATYNPGGATSTFTSTFRVVP